MIYFWGCAALFSVGEWAEFRWSQDQFERWTARLGQEDWAYVAYWWTCAAIFTFLWGIVLTTHRDKVFNWIFRLSPRKLQPWIVGGLDHFVTKWDRLMTAQHTFGKRAWWSRNTLGDMGFILGGKRSRRCRYSSDLTAAQSPRPPELIAKTLLLQAGLNLPFVTVALIQGFKVADWLNPVAEGILDYWLLSGLQLKSSLAWSSFGGLCRL